MSNRASLFAEDTPDPYDPEGEPGPGANTLFVAGSAYHLPVFWMFCFDEEDIAEIPQEEGGRLPTLVSPMDAVLARLAERHRKAQDQFPEHVGVWKRWRKVIAALDRAYLKMDVTEIWILYEDEDMLAAELTEALDWFALGNDYELETLLSLAGIETYDNTRRTFTFDPQQECAEKFLLGWYELEGVE